jgi:hypothetical protein
MIRFLHRTGKKSGDKQDEEEVKFDSDVQVPTKTVEFGSANPLETPTIQSGTGGNTQGGNDVTEIPQEKEEAKLEESSFPPGPDETAEEDLVKEIHVSESETYHGDDVYGELEEDDHWYKNPGDDDGAIALMQEQQEAARKQERIRIMQDEAILDHVCEAWLEVGSYRHQESDFTQFLYEENLSNLHLVLQMHLEHYKAMGFDMPMDLYMRLEMIKDWYSTLLESEQESLFMTVMGTPWRDVEKVSYMVRENLKSNRKKPPASSVSRNHQEPISLLV